MRLFWNDADLRDPFIRAIADTVLTHLERAESPRAGDAVLYPHDVRDSLVSLPDIVEHAERARRSGRRLLVFQISDTTVPIASPNTLVFRTSMLRSKRLPHEHVLPYVWGAVPDRMRSCERWQRPCWTRGEAPPIVGFCGCPNTHPLRKRVLNTLQDRLPCRFLLRDRFWAGAPHDPTVVREFFENILATDLTLAVRGIGNFSHRFYQTLSCGRAPLLVGHDAVMPYEGVESIDWDDVAVRVEADRLDGIESAIERFRERARDHRDLSQRILDVHGRYFTPEAFADHLVRHRDRYLA